MPTLVHLPGGDLKLITYGRIRTSDGEFFSFEAIGLDEDAIKRDMAMFMCSGMEEEVTEWWYQFQGKQDEWDEGDIDILCQDEIVEVCMKHEKFFNTSMQRFGYSWIIDYHSPSNKLDSTKVKICRRK